MTQTTQNSSIFISMLRLDDQKMALAVEILRI